MPFTMSGKPCKVCKKVGKRTRQKWSKQNQKFYLQSTCCDCTAEQTKKHQQDNREKWREYNRKSYQNYTDEQYAKKALRAVLRHKRLHQVHWETELTDFVTEEAHHLRGLRDMATGFLWHVDHVIPLNGRTVSGLHVWNNLAVIPASINLSKGNKLAIHDEWKARLQERAQLGAHEKEESCKRQGTEERCPCHSRQE